MNCLLDTCALIWAISEDDKLSTRTRTVLSDKRTVKHVSSVSLLEMAIKQSIGKLQIEGIPMQELPAILYEHGFELIVLDPFECMDYCTLPTPDGHRDPFDRMLVCQAIARNLTLISADEKLKLYRDCGLSLIW